MMDCLRKGLSDMNRRLRIAINAQILPGRGAGGIESVLVGLIHALGQLDDGPEEYTIITHWQAPEWLRPFIGANQRIVTGPTLTPQVGALEMVGQKLGPLRPLAGKVWALSTRLIPSPTPVGPQVAISDGFYEDLRCDVIHFPYQSFVVTAIPSIYNPHDLQHLHYPQFFDPATIASREVFYRAGCQFSRTVVTESEWAKRDIVNQYALYPDKVQVIPLAAPTLAHHPPLREALDAVQHRYQLQHPFAFYPAMIWEHKNHLRLLEAIALLRDREGLVLRLVCTGYQHPRFWPQVEERIHSLNLHDQVQFLGIVPSEDLRPIYRLAQFVVIPTLFEAASEPVFEAWQEGTPVTCSAVTSLPEQVGDAALLFDPLSIEAIASALRTMATKREVRDELAMAGARRSQDFSWERTAKSYRAVYRRAAGHPLTEEDRFLLSWDWMRERRLEKAEQT